MVSPTIMKCGRGGYMVIIPGVGLMAATSMEEIMQFISDQTTKHFKVPSEFPRIVGNAARTVVDKVRGTDTVMAMIIIGLAVCIGAVYLNKRRDAAEPALTTSTITRTVPLIKVDPPQ